VLTPGHLPFVLAAIASAGVAEVDSAAKAVETEAKPVEVQLDGPEGCSGADAFMVSVRSRTRRVRRAEADELRTTLQVRLSRVHGQVLGELRMIDDRGGTDTRKVQGATCDEVVQALSLTAALALDPTSIISASTPTEQDTTGLSAKPAETAAPPSRPLSGPSVGPEPPSAPTSRPVPSFELGVGAIGLEVLSGSFSPGIAVGARKNLGKSGVFRPALGIALTYVRNDVLQSPDNAQVALAGMGATVCPLRGTVSVVTLQPCALLLGGWLSAAGRQLTHVGTVDRYWLSAGLTARMAAFLGHGISLELEGGATMPLVKRRFFATVPSNVVAETPTLSPVVGIALTYGL
jgi:hypothetical protein